MGACVSFDVIKKCQVCSKQFCELEPHLWAYRKTSHKGGTIKKTDYCSYKCMREAERQKEEHFCIHCGNKLQWKAKKFCDTVCRADYYQKLSNEKQKLIRAEKKIIKQQKKLQLAEEVC